MDLLNKTTYFNLFKDRIDNIKFNMLFDKQPEFQNNKFRY